MLNNPSGVAVDSAGNLVVADAGGNQASVVAASTGTFYGIAMTVGHVYTVAGNGTAGFSGDGGPATSAELNYPSGVAVDGAGNIVVADTGNNRARVVAAKTGTYYGVAMTAGDIYTIAGNGTAGFSGDGGPATSAELDNPIGLTVGGAGNVLVADSANNRVRVVATHTGRFYGFAMTAGDIYTIAGNGTGGFSGDGGPATSAELNYPSGVAVDGAGNLFVADTNNGRVRLVTGGHHHI
jgi:trimeric autotransporter adhesin